MVLNLYCVKNANNCLEKTLESAQEINITFLNAQDVQSPLLRVKTVDVQQLLNNGYNYAYIPTLARYYFIDGAKVLLGGLTEILMKCDYLMSYKTAILNGSGYVSLAQSNNFDSINYIEKNEKKHIIYNGENVFTTYSKVLIVAGAQ